MVSHRTELSFQLAVAAAWPRPKGTVTICFSPDTSPKAVLSASAGIAELTAPLPPAVTAPASVAGVAGAAALSVALDAAELLADATLLVIMEAESIVVAEEADDIADEPLDIADESIDINMAEPLDIAEAMAGADSAGLAGAGLLAAAEASGVAALKLAAAELCMLLGSLPALANSPPPMEALAGMTGV
jgi:hypothetical protein